MAVQDTVSDTYSILNETGIRQVVDGQEVTYTLQSVQHNNPSHNQPYTGLDLVKGWTEPDGTPQSETIPHDYAWPTDSVSLEKAEAEFTALSTTLVEEGPQALLNNLSLHGNTAPAFQGGPATLDAPGIWIPDNKSIEWHTNDPSTRMYLGYQLTDPSDGVALEAVKVWFDNGRQHQETAIIDEVNVAQALTQWDERHPAGDYISPAQHEIDQEHAFDRENHNAWTVMEGVQAHLNTITTRDFNDGVLTAAALWADRSRKDPSAFLPSGPVLSPDLVTLAQAEINATEVEFDNLPDKPNSSAFVILGETQIAQELSTNTSVNYHLALVQASQIQGSSSPELLFTKLWENQTAENSTDHQEQTIRIAMNEATALDQFNGLSQTLVERGPQAALSNMQEIAPDNALLTFDSEPTVLDEPGIWIPNDPDNTIGWMTSGNGTWYGLNVVPDPQSPSLNITKTWWQGDRPQTNSEVLQGVLLTTPDPTAQATAIEQLSATKQKIEADSSQSFAQGMMTVTQIWSDSHPSQAISEFLAGGPSNDFPSASQPSIAPEASYDEPSL